MFNPNPMLLCDFYKLSHKAMYKKGITKVYSTWTPRSTYLEGIDYAVSFGQQLFIKRYFIDYFNENFFSRPKEQVVAEYFRIVKYTLGVEVPETKHIEDLHDLGYLPLTIKSIPEGTKVPLRVPMLTIENTDDRFFWLTNYVETLLSAELWQPMTAATIAHEYKKILTTQAKLTGGDLSFIQFQGHDFSFRGMEGLLGAMGSGMAHLLSFTGTDTIPAIQAHEYYYNANVEKELVGTSIPASEHSIQCSYENDMEYFEQLITEKHPSGPVSIVADGRDFWDVVGRVLPALKDKIIARTGSPIGLDKVVIRPDSGDPVKILCGDKNLPNANCSNGETSLIQKGLVECLWDIFGGTINEAGYRVLDSHIGCIYGDAITRKRATEISEQLKSKGFCSTNVVYGIGSYTYQYNTRDSLGFAVKSTNVTLNGQDQAIFKDPKTDSGTKKSQKGKVAVVRNSKGVITHIDNLTSDVKLKQDMLVEIFRDGKLLVDDTLANIRNRLNENI